MQTDRLLPGWPLLGHSFRKRSREFVSENSLHAVPYFVDPTRPIYQRIMWFLIFITSAIAAVATIVIIWQKFQTSPTLTYLNIERENVSVDFPNVYLCFDERHLDFSNSQFKPTQITVLKLLYKQTEIFSMASSEDIGAVSFKQIFLQATPKCQDFIFDCQFRKRPYDCSSLFAQKIASADGICCEFKSQPITKDDPAWSLQFRLSEYPMNVHVSGKSEGAPLVGQEPGHRLLAPASMQLTTTVTSTADSVRFLARHQRKCAFPEESPSHVDCERTLHKSVMRRECNCLPWFYAQDRSEECSLRQHRCISTIDAQKLTDRKCYVSCEHAAYNLLKIERLRADDESNNNASDSGGGIGSSDIEFASWPDVRFRRVTRFGWLDLVVSFGGVAGFFIGYSIITSLEAAYYFGLRAYCGAVLSVPNKRFNVVAVAPNSNNKARLPPKYAALYKTH